MSTALTLNTKTTYINFENNMTNGDEHKIKLQSNHKDNKLLHLQPEKIHTSNS